MLISALLNSPSQGFYGPSTPDLLAGNPYESASMGTDFSRNAATPSIDYLSIHSYPDQWMKSADGASNSWLTNANGLQALTLPRS